MKSWISIGIFSVLLVLAGCQNKKQQKGNNGSEDRAVAFVELIQPKYAQGFKEIGRAHV